MMCIDHIPQDVLNRFTMRNIGFADAAEVFVLLAGYASWLAYGRAFGTRPVPTVLLRIGRRCWQLYVYQIVLVVVCVSTIRIWRHFWPVPVDFLEPELAHGLDSVWRVLSLVALPGNLNILPLYIVLLLGFAPLYALLRGVGTAVVLGLSGAVWLVVNVDPRLNFPNWLDPDGWFFDPLAWQFLFVLGVCAARVAGRHDGSLPRSYVLAAACGLYLVFSAVQSFPWMDWGFADLRPVTMGGARQDDPLALAAAGRAGAVLSCPVLHAGDGAGRDARRPVHGAVRAALLGNLHHGHHSGSVWPPGADQLRHGVRDAGGGQCDRLRRAAGRCPHPGAPAQRGPWRGTGRAGQPCAARPLMQELRP